MATIESAAALHADQHAHGHIVDALIEERAPNLSRSPLWPLIRPPLYALLGYAKARKMADDIAPMSGAVAMAYVSRLLSLKVETSGAERIPPTGPILILINHPTGVADGVAIYDMLQPIRPDAAFYANADAMRVCPGFDQLLIPVELANAKRSREATRTTLKRTQAVLAEGRALVVFPSGRLARRDKAGVLQEEPWAPTAVSLGRKLGVPLVPIHIDGPYSTLFHLFDRFSGELRDVTLFHELLNKRRGRFRLTVGEPIDANAVPGDPPEAIAALRAYVQGPLGQGVVRFFPSPLAGEGDAEGVG